jgi:MYXO-CTERM domain-containing protein
VRETRFLGVSKAGLGALALGLFLGSSGCSSTDEPGSVRGEFVENLARYEDGRQSVTYTLFVGNDRSRPRELVFSKAPDVLSNTEIRVWGDEKLGKLVVDHFEVVGDLARPGARGISREALVDAAPIEPTSMVMVAVDTGGGLPADIVTTLNAELFSETDPTSLVHYYLDNSYGMHTLTGLVAPKVYPYAMNACDYQGLQNTLKPQVDADTGAADGYDLYLWYFPQTDSCSWSGLSSGRDTFYNGSYGCVVLAQEPGHSFGLSHSSSMACTDASGNPAPFADDPQTNCMHNEYGNGYDTMGGGCRHFSAYQKIYRTYLQGCNVAQVRTSGTFTLFPIEEACNGIQAIQVPMPKVRPFASSGGGSGDRTTQLGFYNVELRAPIGVFDGTPPTGRGTPMVPSVLINVAPDWRIFQTGGRNNRGEHIWLLDMTPGGGTTRGGNGSQHALAQGQTFTDPAGGVSITTEAVSATSATIRVDIAPAGAAGAGGGGGMTGGGGAPTTGAPATCLDDTPLMAPGPNSCGNGGPVVTGGSGGMAGGGGLAGGGGITGGGAGGVTGGGAGGLTGGSAGANATGGAGGVPPMGGASGAGPAAGAGPTAGSSNKVVPEQNGDELDGGCGCRVAGERPTNHSAGALALLGLTLAGALRRRRQS